MMRVSHWIFIATLALIASPLLADGETLAWEDWTSERCRIVWEYPDSEAGNIAGFRVYRGQSRDTVDTSPPVDAASPRARQVTCARLKVTQPGQWYVTATAYTADGRESLPAEVLAFVLAPAGLAPPRGVKIILAP